MPRKPPPREQLYIPDTEPPRNLDIEAALGHWLNATDAAKAASEDKRLCHDVLLARLGAAGLPSYPYLDRATGRRRLARAVAETKIKAVNAPAEKADKADRERDMAGESSAAERAARDLRERNDARDRAAAADIADRDVKPDNKPSKSARALRAARGPKATPKPRPVPTLVPPLPANERAELEEREAAAHEADPFGATRAQLDGAEAELTPAQRAAAESARAREARRNGKARGAADPAGGAA